MFANNLSRLNQVKEAESLNDEDLNFLRDCEKIHFKELELHGNKYPAWRIVYNTVLGPAKGGIRFHPDVNEDEVKSLSFWMSLKNSLLELPFGGAKGGIQVNPKDLSESDLQELSRTYVRAFSDVIGQDKDIPAPDVYTNSQVMSWMLDEFESIKERHEPGAFTGKPISLGGIELRQDATAEGAFLVFQKAMDDFGLSKAEINIAIQGFGNAGSLLAEKLYKNGYKIVAVSDSSAGLYNQSGLDILKLSEFKNNKGKFSDYNKEQIISNEEILELNVQVLALAALEDQITDKNVGGVKAKYILELANGPVSYEADEVLFNKQVMVLPDILVNAGGVLASYYEWVQNRTGSVFLETDLKDMFNDRMRLAWERVYNKYQADKKEKSLRQVAYALSITRLSEAGKYRGRLK